MVALVTFVTHGLWSGWERGLLQGLAVVLIACPCALGLATPLAVWSALGRAAGAQVLFRSGDALERLAEVRAVRFDKTGTLTTGTPAVTTLACEAGADRDDVILRATLLADASSHVLARAIVRSLGRPAAGLAEDVDRRPSVRRAGDRGQRGDRRISHSDVPRQPPSSRGERTGSWPGA